MKAIVHENGGGADTLKISEVDDVKPLPNQILVSVRAAGINRADIMQREGKYPPPKGASEILGLEISGEVSAVGSEVTKWKKGDRVFGLVPGGGYAGQAVIHEEMAMRVPGNLSFVEAAAIPEVFLTAYQALIFYGKIKSDETVLIHAGASGVGTAAIQMAHELKAKIIITASEEKHYACLKLGAGAAIDYKKQDFAKEVLSITENTGVDLIIDFIGAPYLQKNIDILKTDGRLIMLSFIGGGIIQNFDTRKMISKRLSIIGSALRSRSIDYQINLVNEFSLFALDKFNSRILVPVVDKVFNWNDAASAHKYIEANKNIGKVILEIKQ